MMLLLNIQSQKRGEKGEGHLMISFTLIHCNSNFVPLLIAVSSGSLVKQAIADDTKSGQAARAYIEKSMMGKMQIYNINSSPPILYPVLIIFYRYIFE